MPGKDERFVRAWLDYNGAYLLWPYVRSFVANVTSQGRYARLTLDTRQLPLAPEFESEEDVRPTASSEA